MLYAIPYVFAVSCLPLDDPGVWSFRVPALRPTYKRTRFRLETWSFVSQETRARLRFRAYPDNSQPVILSLTSASSVEPSKGDWRLGKAAPFDELRVLKWLFG